MLNNHPALLDELERYYEGLFVKGEIEKFLSKNREMAVEVNWRDQLHEDMMICDLGVWPDFHELKEEFYVLDPESDLAKLSAGDCDLLNKNVVVIKRRLPFSLLCDEIASHYCGSGSPAFSQGITQEASEKIYRRMEYLTDRSKSGTQYKNLRTLIRLGVKPNETWVWDRWKKLLDAIHCYFCPPQ